MPCNCARGARRVADQRAVAMGGRVPAGGAQLDRPAVCPERRCTCTRRLLRHARTAYSRADGHLPARNGRRDAIGQFDARGTVRRCLWLACGLAWPGTRLVRALAERTAQEWSGRADSERSGPWKDAAAARQRCVEILAASPGPGLDARLNQRLAPLWSSERRCPQIVFVRLLDAYFEACPWLQIEYPFEIDHPVDFRRVGMAARKRADFILLVDDDLDLTADFCFEQSRRDFRLHFHEALQALLLQLFRHGIGKRVRRGPFHGRILEATDPIELRLPEKSQQLFELSVRLARKTDNEGRAQGEIGHGSAPGLDT